MRTANFVSVFLILLFTAGCSWLPKPKDETEGWSASRIYSEAKTDLKEGDYEQAIKYFEILESRYPFGRYAQQAQIEVAYAYYKYDEPESAIAAADRFIKLHPRHPNVDYAYYLKGLVNFNRNSGFVERIFPQDPSTRDPASARQAFLDFRELVQKYPDSRYALDASKRMYYLRNMLAKHEVNVAKYYLRRGALVAAADRAKYVVEHYDGALVMPDALTALAEAYRRMGLDKLAQDADRVLNANYPGYSAKSEKSGWWPF